MWFGPELGHARWDMSRTDRLTETSTAPPAADPAANTFSVSMVMSGIRCLLTHLGFPWVLQDLDLTDPV